MLRKFLTANERPACNHHLSSQAAEFIVILEERIIMEYIRRGCIAVALIAGLPVAALAATSDTGAAQGDNEYLKMDLTQLMEIEIPSVYAASKRQQFVTSAPSSVSIITADDIKRYGWRTVADIIKSVRGFYSSYDRNYNYTGNRGFSRAGDYDTRFLVLIDGHRYNENVYDSAASGTEFVLDIDLIEKIEFIRGPGSSLYGANAFFGVINILTKSGNDIAGYELAGSAARYDSYQGRLSYGETFGNGVDLFLSATAADSKGSSELYYPEFDDPATGNGIARNKDGDEFHSMFAKIELGDFTFQTAFSSRDKAVPTASYGAAFNEPGSTEDQYGYGEIRYLTRLTDQLKLDARGYYDHYEYRGYYSYDYADEGDPIDIVVNKDFTRGERWGADLQLSGSVDHLNAFVSGVEVRNNSNITQKNFDIDPALTGPAAVYLDDRRDSVDWGVFGQGEVQLLDDVVLSAGARYDRYESFGGTTNPRVALVYSPEKETAIKFIYGEAFRAPNSYELYYHDDFDTQKPALDLDPETITTYEAVLERYFWNNYYATFSVFHYSIDDLISLVEDQDDGLVVFTNSGKTEANGVEIGLQGSFEAGLRGRVSYAFQDSEDKEQGQKLSNSPQHLAKLNISVPLVRDDLSAGLEVQYASSRNSVRGVKGEDFWVANLTVLFEELIPNLDITLSVYNLFEEKYGDPGSFEHEQEFIEQDDRICRVKGTYRFH